MKTKKTKIDASRLKKKFLDGDIPLYYIPTYKNDRKEFTKPS